MGLVLVVPAVVEEEDHRSTPTLRMGGMEGCLVLLRWLLVRLRGKGRGRGNKGRQGPE